MKSFLDPVAKLINVCQQSNSSAADAAEAWLQLLNEAPGDLKSHVVYRIKKSKVFNQVTLSANYFHPVYRGAKLSDEQNRMVTDYIIDSLDATGMESARIFEKNEGVFGILNQKGITSPKTYWFYASQRGHTALASFASKLLKIPASTAQLERLFSQWSFVHNDVRNRLSVERSKKLINIYFTLRAADIIPEEDDFITE